MARQSRRTTELILRYLEENKEKIISGKMSKKGLARIILTNHPNLFSDIESIRSVIRNHTTTGTARTCKKLFVFNSTPAHGLKANIPESRATGANDFVIEGVSKMLTFMDVHIPYHSVEPLEAMFMFCQGKGIDGILINGDLIDMYMISRWNKDPNKATMKEELEMTKEFFEFLRSEYPEIPIFYKLGNHEDRWETYLKTNAAELYGNDFLSLEKILDLERFKIQLIGSKQRIKFGKLNIVHGHEFGESIFSPVNPARGLFLRAKCSTLCGHHHQTSEHHENNLNSDSMACFTVGCMCYLNPDYRPFASTKWNHGFAIIDRLKNDGFRVNNYRVIDGQVI